jgi:serine/threonine protein kinase
MEYVEGGQLLSRLRSNEKYVSRVIEQVINAVDYVHSCGIVHRDIKP